jgi:CI repressor-like protein
MPRYGEPPEAMTPFAQVLVNYMWNRRPWNRPPLTAPQLAVKIGVPKQSITNWILRGSVPPFETILIILAKLGISMRELYDAYAAAGLAVPAWDDAELARLAEAGAPAPTEVPDTPRRRKPTTVTTSNAPAPRPYVTPAPYDATAAQADEYQRIIAQTEATMRASGAPESLIADVIAHIRTSQNQPPNASPIHQHLIEEHTDNQGEDDSEDKNELDTTSQPSTSRPSGKHRAGHSQPS